MGVTPGYKQTEVGMIPEDWDVVSADDACLKIQDGTHFSPKLGGNDFLYITSRNIRFGYLDVSSAPRIDAAQHRSIYKRCDVKKGDLLLTKDGANTGNAALNSLDEEFSLLSSVAFLRFDPHRHCPRYFLQQTLAPAGQRQIQDAMAGNAITRLTLEKIKNLRFPLPPNKAEQEAIAEALSDMDGLIESLQHLIAKKSHLKQGVSRELLRPKEGWVSKRLEGLAEIRSGGTPSTTKSEFWDGDVSWCTPTDITALKGHKYLWETSRTITVEGLKCSSAEMIPANSIVMTSRATIGECAINRKPVSTNQGFKNLIPFEGVDVEFLYYLLQTKKQGFISLCGGSTFLEIGKTQLAAFEVELPTDKKEQTDIASILSDMDSEIAALEARLAKARQVKQGMMHNLLTGKIRFAPQAHKIIPFARANRSEVEPARSHNWQFNEAVVISVLAKHFGTEQYPLNRKRYTKLSYLLHRRAEGQAKGYLKKAAGPYNPATKYKGPEGIAEKNGYILPAKRGQYTGFIAAEAISDAEEYFSKWYGNEVLVWLERFRYRKSDDLERLTTVDMAMQELLKQGKTADLSAVRTLIASETEWLPKLNRSIFSDSGIEAAIAECHVIFAR